MVMDEKTPKWADFDWIMVIFGAKNKLITPKKLAKTRWNGELVAFELGWVW